MTRLLATTATALVLSTGVYAAEHGDIFTEYDGDPSVELYASDLVGARIYATEAEVEGEYEPGDETEWDDLGEINDMVLSPEGEVEVVILGVGGFLGIGERNVAVKMSDLQIVRDGDDATDYFLVINANRAMVEQAPEYRRPAPMTAATEETVEMEEDAEAEMEETAAEGEAAMEEAEAEVEQEAAELEQGAEEAAAEGEAAMENAEAEVESEMTEAEAEMDRPGLMAPDVARDGFAAIEINELTAEDLEGARVYGPGDEDVGEIDELLLSEDGGTIDEAVIDVGGFLGIGERPIVVGFDELRILRSEDGTRLRVYIDSSEESLKSLPEYEG